MPEQRCAPTEIEIHVKPYVRKYVLARLGDPKRVATDDSSRRLYTDLERELRGRRLVAVVQDYDPHHGPRTKVRLLVEPRPNQQPEVSYYHHRYVTGMLTKAFLREMYGWVDWYRHRLGMSTGQALQMFRRHYDITEDDHSLETARRMYSHHLRGRSRVRSAVNRS